MTAHSAGVLAHGLHAVAHHIALHRLPLLSVDASMPSIRTNTRPAIRVQVSSSDIPAWLPTVYVDDIEDQAVDGTTGARIHRHRYVRLADSGVVIDLLSVERASTLSSITGGAA